MTAYSLPYDFSKIEPSVSGGRHAGTSKENFPLLEKESQTG
jgi:hypothetical protein